ncbi:MAG: hypothetical protein HY901_12845, partial [Deltaproteobacteria bacterium]|nr:hypothetical protein [Deltaproteobacteria bacterium]
RHGRRNPDFLCRASGHEPQHHRRSAKRLHHSQHQRREQQHGRARPVPGAALDLAHLIQRNTHRRPSLQAFEGRPGVELSFVHEGDPSAELDRDQMAQVLTNLVANAIDAMPQGGRIEVRSGGDADHVWFKVQDAGTGIPPQNMSKLFEPFFTTKPMGKGTGLGLAVTYGIVKMHRGDIRVESNADPSRGATGTTFTVTVPRRPAQE